MRKLLAPGRPGAPRRRSLGVASGRMTLGGVTIVMLVTAGCSAIERLGGGLAATLGAATDSFCDRRIVTGPSMLDKQSAFCQEIVDTVAGSEFREDCVQKFGAATGEGTCNRAGSVGGCEIDEVERDGSQVTDWYYAEDGGPDGAAGVRELCADRARYDRGAHFLSP